MAKIVIWVNYENLDRVSQGLSAIGFPDQSTNDSFQIILPITAVVFDGEVNGFIILDKQDW